MRQFAFTIMSLILGADTVSVAAIAAQTQRTDSVSRTEPRQDPNNPVTQPLYPDTAKKSRDEGAIILGFRVRSDGSVDASSIRVDRSCGVPALDQAAKDEAAKWRFLPATENGKAVDSDHQFRVVFQLSMIPAIASPPKDVLRPPPLGPVCEGIPVLTSNGPRALLNVAIEGKQETWNRVRAEAMAIGIPAPIEESSSASSTHLGFDFTSRVQPEKGVEFYNRIVSGEFGDMTGDSKIGMRVVVDSIHRMIAMGCVTKAIFEASFPKPELTNPDDLGYVPEPGVPLN